MSNSEVTWVVPLAWLLARQVRKRPIVRRGAARRRTTVALLAAGGTAQFAAYAHSHSVDATTLVLLAASFTAGASLGAVRAFTVRIWIENGRLFRQGTALTIALWLLGTGLHLAVDRDGAGSASMLLYLAIAVTVQTQALRRRVRRFLRAARSG